MNALANWMTAFGTVAVAVLAIWGDYVRAKLARPSLRLELCQERGTMGSGELWIHLLVHNAKWYFPAANCMVCLRGIARLENQIFSYHSQPELHSFFWSPRQSGLQARVTDKRAIDFGILSHAGFQPRMSYDAYAAQAAVDKNQRVLYFIEIIADNFSNGPVEVVEVWWDGKWSEASTLHDKHLKISLIPREQWRATRDLPSEIADTGHW